MQSLKNKFFMETVQIFTVIEKSIMNLHVPNQPVLTLIIIVVRFLSIQSLIISFI